MEGSGHSVKTIAITADRISKDFNRRSVFKGISFSLKSPESLAITGKNGAGKSTLVKIIAGILRPTQGSMAYSVDNVLTSIEEFKHHIGFVSSYLNLYDEFTTLENLSILSRIRSNNYFNRERARELLTNFALWDRRDDIIGTFSSGMKQRMKYTFALLHRPELLILDEPASNLDMEGIDFIKQISKEQVKNGILIVATSDSKEAALCQEEINLGN
jgi:heme exporter protein A